MPARPTRILIIDDHAAFRCAARELLEERGFAVVGEAGSARSALEAAAALAPDGVLLDVRLGEDSGVEVALALTRAQPALPVVLISTEPLDRCPERLRACGACGFVLKSELVRTDLSGFWRR